MRPQFYFKILAIFLCTMPLLAQTDKTPLPKVTSEGMFTITETRYWDASKAQNGYTLFAASGRSYLVDMEGYVVNQWNIGTNPKLLITETSSMPRNLIRAVLAGFEELDWNGNIVWTYTRNAIGLFSSSRLDKNLQ